MQWYNQLHQHELLEIVDKEEEDNDSTEDAGKKTEDPDPSAVKSSPGEST